MAYVYHIGRGSDGTFPSLPKVLVDSADLYRILSMAL